MKYSRFDQGKNLFVYHNNFSSVILLFLQVSTSHLKTVSLNVHSLLPS